MQNPARGGVFCGGGEIRNLGRDSTHASLDNRWFRPLTQHFHQLLRYRTSDRTLSPHEDQDLMEYDAPCDGCQHNSADHAAESLTMPKSYGRFRIELWGREQKEVYQLTNSCGTIGGRWSKQREASLRPRDGDAFLLWKFPARHHALGVNPG
jgi:hypothetical protein